MWAAFGIALCALALVNGQDFTCKEGEPKIVNFYGNELTCPDELICNNKYKSIGSAKPKPCVAASSICEYTCSDKNDAQVVINTVTFNCKDGQQCNSKKLTCEVCVAKPCDPGAYKCKTGATGSFIMGGFEYNCPTDTVCNKDYEQPCSACIKSKNANTPDPEEPELRKTAKHFYFKSNFA